MKTRSATYLFYLSIICCLLRCAPSSAQDKAKSWQERVYLEYYVEDKGDTVYVDELRPSVVFPRIKRNTPDLRKYARLVYNFNRVYPYTSVARQVIDKADADIAGMKKIQKERYVNKVQEQLLDDFSDVARKMTISQGKLLIRLVDREVEFSHQLTVRPRSPLLELETVFAFARQEIYDTSRAQHQESQSGKPITCNVMFG